jgi:serine/threonine protein kinase
MGCTTSTPHEPIQIGPLPSPNQSIDKGEPHIRLTIRDFHIYRQIGKGGFAEVFLARRLFYPWDLVAIKRVEKSRVIRNKSSSDAHRNRLMTSLRQNHGILPGQPDPIPTPEQERDIRVSSTVWTERTIWEQVQGSPHVSPLLHAVQDRDYLYFVVPLLPMGDLAVYIRTYGVMSNAYLQFVAAQCVLALESLHSANIVYRDLKPHNLLIDARGNVSITDFGLCRVSTPGGDGLSDLKGRVGTKGYQAPEIIYSNTHSYPVDFYALGVTLYRLATDLRIGHFEDKRYKNNLDQIFDKFVHIPRVVLVNQSQHDFALLSQLPRTHLHVLPPQLRRKIGEWMILEIALFGTKRLFQIKPIVTFSNE